MMSQVYFPCVVLTATFLPQVLWVLSDAVRPFQNGEDAVSRGGHCRILPRSLWKLHGPSIVQGDLSVSHRLLTRNVLTRDADMHIFAVHKCFSCVHSLGSTFKEVLTTLSACRQPPATL